MPRDRLGVLKAPSVPSGPTPRPPRHGRRPQGPKEASLARAALRLLRATPGCHAVKAHGSPFSRAGEPDLHGSYRGRALAVELKRPGAHLTPMQERALVRWRRAGAAVAVCRSLDDVRALLDTIRAEWSCGRGANEAAQWADPR
jgi:hypothetical protein